MYKLLIIFGMVLFVSCQSANKKSTPSGKIESEIVLAEDTLSISGMHCDMCVSSIEKGVSELAGIESVKANLGDSTAVVKYDVSQTSREEIERAIEKRGYTVKTEL